MAEKEEGEVAMEMEEGEIDLRNGTRILGVCGERDAVAVPQVPVSGYPPGGWLSSHFAIFVTIGLAC